VSLFFPATGSPVARRRGQQRRPRGGDSSEVLSVV